MTSEQVGNQHGFICPRCKSGQSIRIAAMIWADLVPDGTDNSNSDTEWSDENGAQCSDCSWTGKVKDLETVEVQD